MTNSGEQPTLTLTAKLTALDSETAIIWSIEDGADFAKLDQSDNNAVITPLSPGKITVKAETADGNYFDTAEIFIIPHINSIKIGGTVAVGETVRAIVYTFPTATNTTMKFSLLFPTHGRDFRRKTTILETQALTPMKLSPERPERPSPFRRNIQATISRLTFTMADMR